MSDVTAESYQLAKMKLEKALATLGVDQYEVAASLDHLGIRGTPCQEGMCPVAKYLRKNKELSRVRVASEMVEALVEVDHNWLSTHINSPFPIRAFVRAFDSGGYPDLVYKPKEKKA